MNSKLKDLINSPGFSGGSLAYHALQPEMEIDWLNGFALPRAERYVIGDPIQPLGATDSFPDPADLHQNYPNLSFAHIGAKFARALEGAGYHIAALGCEAWVNLPFSLSGADKSDLRRALNRSLKAEVRVREVSERNFPALAHEVELANTEWLKSRPLFHREFRFLARPYVRGFQRGERRFVAFQGGRAVGLAVYDPIIRAGEPEGYFEAIVRSYRDSPPGVRDLLTTTALGQFATEGTSRVSLGLCPFRPQSDNTGILNSRMSESVLKVFYRHGWRIFNCKGLAFHKSRYRPCFKTVYFATLSRFTLIELYQLCRLSNIDALYPIRRLREAVTGRVVGMFAPGHRQLEAEQHTS